MWDLCSIFKSGPTDNNGQAQLINLWRKYYLRFIDTVFTIAHVEYRYKSFDLAFKKAFVISSYLRYWTIFSLLNSLTFFSNLHLIFSIYYTYHFNEYLIHGRILRIWQSFKYKKLISSYLFACGFNKEINIDLLEIRHQRLAGSCWLI